MNHSTTTKCCNKHFPLLLTIFNNRPTAFCHCPLPPVTVNRFLSPLTFQSNRPPPLVTLPTASCYSPPLAITNHGFLLLTRSFRSLLPPPVNSHPFYYCSSYPIPANCFLSLPTASYFNYTLRLVVVSWSLQHYFIPLCNLEHCIALFICYAKNIRYFLKPSCT